ncbi:MAG TPA: dihydroorotate dehydrogenase [Thermodesulfobacteriota bacterium]|jgi:dihydroorotate dehydrogenase (NAD+) catalytic subunit|nr:dihydroorotate dehydrogenase [Thermodesulfobacteriota bacterium]
MVNTAVNIGGIPLKNPVIAASGTFGYGLEFSPLLDLNELGGIVVKGLSLNPYPGNPPPRIMETTGGMLNSIGLQNIGVDAFIKEKLPLLRNYDVAIFVNIFGHTIEEYVRIARRLSETEGIAGLEVNISCPNIKKGGMSFGKEPKQAGLLTKRIRKATSLPLMIKLTPQASDIADVAKRVEGEGADSISLVNTFLGMAIDVDTAAPLLSTITGGLSGPAIKPIALRMVWEVAQKVSIPVVGLGGIASYRDALEFMIAGAQAVQVGTANFINPTMCREIIHGIKEYLKAKHIDDIKQLIGSLNLSGHETTSD